MNLNQRLARVFNAPKPIEYITVSQASAICKKDCPHPEDGKVLEAYTKANKPSIYVLGNTWIGMIAHHSKRASYYVTHSIMENGLIYTIRITQELCDGILHEEPDLTTYEAYALWSDWMQNSFDEDLPEDRRQLLQAMRYPKRYSPALQTDVLNKGIEDFLQLNKEMKYINYNPIAKSWLTRETFKDITFFDAVFDVVQQIINGTPLSLNWWGDTPLNWDTLCAWANSADLDRHAADWNLAVQSATTTGATFELSGEKNTFLNKIKILKKNFPYYKALCYPWSKGALDVPDSCAVKAVPKSYKTPRIIAKEPVVRNYVATAIRKVTVNLLEQYEYCHYDPELEDYQGVTIELPYTGEYLGRVWSCLDVTDQEKNREVCWESSWLQKFATIDHSSASDRISKILGTELFPIFAVIPELRSSTLVLDDGKSRDSQIFLTSGHPLTFLCETIVYYAIGVVATDFYRACRKDRRIKYFWPMEFGDDMCIDYRVAECYMQIASLFGLKVNFEKSFMPPSNYRESCGVEYLNGYPMHGIKWPRTTYDWTNDESIAEYATSFITLQHSLYYQYWDCSEFIACVVCSLEPQMTYSSPSTESTDLWSDVIQAKTVEAPHDGALSEECSKWAALREIHAVPQSYVQLDKDEAKKLTDPDLELALYVDFLINGPKYSDSLAEILHVSDPVDRRPLVKRPKVRFVRVRR